MSYDIFNPNISSVPKGMEGKTILVYGSNRTGKTYQGAKLPKPFYLGFESGINGISGIPFLPVLTWSDFIKLANQLTNPLTLDKAREMYQTLLFDSVDVAALLCQDYVCSKYGSDSIATGNKGYGLWKEYEQEFFRQINKLTSVGYTVYFISHEGTRKFYDENNEEYEKIYPTGDKRSIDPVCNLVDIIAYARVNGMDENGEEIKSSLYLKNTRFYHAGSRFDYLTPFIKEFTAENLQKAIADAVEMEEKNGGTTTTFTGYKVTNTVQRTSFEEMKEFIKEMAMKLQGAERFNEYVEVIEKYLGKGESASTATKEKFEQIDLIYTELKTIQV